MHVRSVGFEEPGLKEEWNGVLNEKDLVSKTYFQTWEWNSTWWEIYGKQDRSKTLLLLLVLEMDSVVAIAPFIIQSRIVFNLSLWEHIVWLGFDLSPYPDIITPKSRVQEVWDAIFDYVAQKHSSMWFEFQDVYSFSALSFVKFRSKYWVRESTNMCLRANCFNEEELLKRSRGLRRKHRQVWKLLESNRSIRWVPIKEQRFLPFHTFVKLNKLRFGSKSYFSQHCNYAFVSTLLRKDPNRMIYFLVMKEDEILHCILCFWLNDTVHYFLSGMNIYARNLQPGFINFFHTLPYLYSNGVKIFDFGKGAERYKLDFTPEMSESKKYFIVPNLSLFFYFFAYVIRRLMKVGLIFNRKN